MAGRHRPPPVLVREEPPEACARDFREILHGYSLEEAKREARRCAQCEGPMSGTPCVEACPIGQDVREYAYLLGTGNIDDAARVVLQSNPLASTLCKVCYRYCEKACKVGRKNGEPLAIRHLKRAVLEYAGADLAYVQGPRKEQKVAIIGGGPAGLMAAWELCLRGYPVTLFEQERTLGGQTRVIPRYRMAGGEIEADLARFRDLDITFVMGKKAGRDFTLESLFHDGYQAVYLAIGANSDRKLGIPGEDLPGVLSALDFLRKVSGGERGVLGNKVAVIGGGNVAVDAARSATRLTKDGEVSLIYRRSRKEMPADDEEIRGAEREGVRFVFLHAPVGIVGTGHVQGIVLQDMELGPPDSSGRRSSTPVLGSERTVPCDTVIVAAGQTADLKGLPERMDIRIGSHGWPEGSAPDFAAGMEGVFASGGESVVHAMAAGSQAAVAIDGYLRRKNGEAPIPRPDAFGGSEPPQRRRGGPREKRQRRRVLRAPEPNGSVG